MVRRFALGGLLGALLGGGLGFGALHLLRVGTNPTLALFVSAAIGACVVVLVRRPIWRQGSSVESLLFTLLGLALGAGAQFLLHRFVDVALPFDLPPIAGGARLTEQPAVYGPLVGWLVGSLVGIEPAPAASAPAGRPPVSPARAAAAEPSESAESDRA